MNDDYKYETERYDDINLDVDDYTTRIVKSFYQIVGLVDNINVYKRRAEEYPAVISKKHANGVQSFLENVGDNLQDYESLFNEMDE